MTEEGRLVSIHEVPPFLRFNPYIRRGYRPAPIPIAAAARSVFGYLHNETTNIVIHLLSAVVMLYFTVSPPVPYQFVGELVPSRGATEPPHERDLSAGVDRQGAYQQTRFLLSFISLLIAVTFLLSTVYHTFMCCCHHVNQYYYLLQCDVTGVLCSIVGSVTAYFYRGNKCFYHRRQEGGWAEEVGENSVYYGCLVLIVVSSLLVLYMLILGPIQRELTYLARVLLVYTVLDGAVFAVGRVLEIVWGTPRHGSRRAFQPPSPQSYNMLLKQYFISKKRFRAFWYRTADPHPPKSSREANVVISPQLRGITVLVFITTHFVCYVVMIYPKYSQYGFTNAVYYHGMSYVYLLVGGALNATRMPERLLCHLERRARRERRVSEAQDTELQLRWKVSQEQGRPLRRVPVLSLAYLTQLGERLSLPQLVVHCCISARDVCYVCNSHSLWHLASTLCGLSTLMATYYDCIEYEVMTCTA
ncbi:hypothetical protein AGDE_13933 [Angomonas deanei]|uniref:Haemolysin-III related, putative n=1 Tax=Angomonas deanei TaxID=59799 RepID=A0A7G2CMA4_9TRYP|nr:hypothetical protein AGDE_13933 [Angomonas deanei]CAD2220041.1 Haemolysin-III related, putative [Angomonas deanei]|eukprot:EPY21593.1 hypothetical protein AGDE_13933 [Angomonas deanei]